MKSWHNDIVLDRLDQIQECITLINGWSARYDTVNDFLESPTGMVVLDACIMRLQVIGETIRSIDNMTDGELFANYPETPWKKIVGLRNIISHEYSNINYDTIVDIIKKHLNPLEKALEKVIRDMHNCV